MANELAEQEEIPMEHHAPEAADALQPERHTHIAQADGSPDGEDDPLDVELEDEPEEAEPEAIVIPQGENETAAEALEEAGPRSEN